MLISFKRNWNLFYSRWGGTTIYWQTIFSYGLLIKEYRYWLNRLIKQSNEAVLDVGAGKLFYRKLIREFSTNYKSLDIKQTHPDLDFIGTTSKTNQKGGTYSLVFCSQVLEHVPDPQESFDEIYRILKKDGYAVISVPFFMYLHEEPNDYFRYTKYALRFLSKKAGFEIVELTEIGGPFAMVATLTASVLIGISWNTPIINWLMYGINLFCQQIFRFGDFLVKPSKKILPSNYLLVLRKL